MACVRSAWLVLGSLTLLLEDPSKGYFCTELNLGFPEVREVTSNRPDQDGVDDRTRYMGSRVVSANITALAGAGAQIDDVADNFAPFMIPSARPVLHYVLDRPGTPERTLTLRASQYSWPIAGPYQRDIQLQWVAADPVARDGITHTATSYAGSSTPPGRQYNLIFNRIYPPGSSAPSSGVIRTYGDLPIRPVFRIYGPITAPNMGLSRYDPATGTVGTSLYFLPGFIIGSGQGVEVDYGAKTAVRNDGTSVQSQIDWGHTTWTNVPPNPGYVQFPLYGQSTSGVTQAVASWQDAFLT